VTLPRKRECYCGECRKCRICEATQTWRDKENIRIERQDAQRMPWPVEYFGLRTPGRYGQYDGDVSTSRMRLNGDKG
jgi:hypothetical protein